MIAEVVDEAKECLCKPYLLEGDSQINRKNRVGRYDIVYFESNQYEYFRISF